MFQLSTDGILQYEAHRLCYVFSNVPINQLYDRYNAAQDGQYCVKWCKTLSVASVERLSQFAAAQPSAALRAMEGILRTLRCTPLVFACAKKIYAWQPFRPAIRSFSEGWWSRRDSNSRPSHCQCDALAN